MMVEHELPLDPELGGCTRCGVSRSVVMTTSGHRWSWTGLYSNMLDARPCDREHVPMYEVMLE